MTNTTTNQVRDYIPNPEGKGGFGDHPENRGDGRWSKDNSFSYWMNYFKHLSVEEFKDYETTKSDKERTVAESIAYARVMAARKDINEFREVANRTEGMPKQFTDITSGGEKINTLYDYFSKLDTKSEVDNPTE